MRNFIFQKGNRKYSLNVDYIKYCIGLNYKEKYYFKQIIREFFINSKESEYSLNNTGKARLFINDKEINNKNVTYIYVDHNYSIQDDLKLSSKSLIAKYLETLISRTDNIDTINSFNILLESFGNELDDNLVTSRFMTYTPKLFLKILLPIFIWNDEQANEYDLDYNDNIIFQLNMIDYLSKNSSTNKYLCLLEIPLLTKEIKECLDKMNCIVVVLLNKYEVVPKLKDIYLFDKTIVDLSNDEDLYDLFLSRGICTLEEAKDKMKRLLNKEKEKLDMSILNDR